MRDPSAPLTVVLIFNCVLPPEGFEGPVVFKDPLTLEPLTGEAAAAEDMEGVGDGRR